MCSHLHNVVLLWRGRCRWKYKEPIVTGDVREVVAAEEEQIAHINTRTI